MGENCAGWVESDETQHECQFADEPDDNEFLGKAYCRFHLPMGDPGQGGKADWDDARKTALSDAITARLDTEMEKPEEDRRTVDLRGIVVPGHLKFSNEALPGLLLSNAQISGYADFSHVEFSGVANFDEALFSGNAYFRMAQFSGHANFGRAQFSRSAGFDDAQFSGNALFFAAQFSRGALFFAAHFSGDAYFRMAQFLGDADFSGSTEQDRSPANTFQSMIFDGATIAGEADFSNRRFLASSDFRVQQFATVPSFAESALHQDTVFPPEQCFADRSGDRAADRYRILRLAMENQRDRLNEGMFYALEQESRRRSGELSGIAALINRGYALGSNYGLSIMRPLALFAAIIFVCSFLMVGVTSLSGVRGADVDRAGRLGIAGDALVYSVRQSVIPFDAMRQRPEAIKEWKLFPEPYGLFQVLAAIQSVLSALTILLLILAVRWRYRR